MDIYPLLLKNITSKLTKLIEGSKTIPGHLTIRSYQSSRRHGEKYKEHCDRINGSLDKLFDIYCSDSGRRANLAENHFTMTDADEEFYQSMANDRAFTCVEDKKVAAKDVKKRQQTREREMKRLRRQNLSFESVSGEDLAVEIPELNER